MSALGKATIQGVLVTSLILIVAVLLATPNATTLSLAIAIGFVVALSTCLRERRR